jgi:uncharacterized protein (DUF58 family)
MRDAVYSIDTLLRQPSVVLGLATVVALAVFVVATPRALPMFGGLVATLGIGIVGPWLALRGLRGRINFGADRCRVGDRVGFDLAVTRFGRLVATPPAVAWPTTAGNDSRAVAPRRRGRFPQDGSEPLLTSNWPFGIATAVQRLDVPRPLVVRPLTMPVRFPFGMITGRRPGRDASTGLHGKAGDVLGVREYRPGDNVRSIHWPQTARRGDVVVCERPGTAAARVRILLGHGTPAGMASRSLSSGTDSAAVARLDAAVGVASSLVESWSARGAELEVVWPTPDGGTAWWHPRDCRSLDDTLDALACLESIGPQPLRDAAGSSAVGFNPTGLRAVDLEIFLDVADDRTSPQASSTLASGPPRPGVTQQLVIAFAAPVGSDAILLPVSAAAAARLDRVFAEIGHDPDAPCR